MTKKDYILIAKVLHDNATSEDIIIMHVYDSFIHALKNDNAKFNAKKFYQAVFGDKNDEIK